MHPMVFELRVMKKKKKEEERRITKSKFLLISTGPLFESARYFEVSAAGRFCKR